MTVRERERERERERRIEYHLQDFIGRPAAMELAQASFTRKLAMIQFDPQASGLPSEWKTIPQNMEVIRREGQEPVSKFAV